MTTTQVVRILLVSGSTRARSTNTAALRAAHTDPPAGVATVLYTGISELPAFNSDDERDRLPVVVATLREQLDSADAVLFCTPEYAGALPGSFKNLLDWTVGAAPGLDGKPVGWVNVAAPGRGLGAYAELATVLGYVNAQIVEGARADLYLAHAAVDPSGTVTDPEFGAGMRAVLGALAEVSRPSR